MTMIAQPQDQEFIRQDARLRTRAVTIVATCFAMNVLARGCAETFTVFVLPVSGELGWSRSQMTAIYASYMIALGFSAPFIGICFDRLGGRITYLLGLLCYGVGMLIASRMTSLWEAYVGLGLLTGIGVTAISMLPSTGLISRWYDRRLSTAMAFASAGLGCGVIAVIPLAQILIDSEGWRATYWVMGSVLLTVAPLIALLPMWREWETGHPGVRQRNAKTGEPLWKMLSGLMASPPFWGIFSAFFFTSFTIFGLSVQAVPYLVEIGFSPLEAASAFGVVGFLSIAGIITTGWLADRFGRRATVTVSYLLTMVGVVALWALSIEPTYTLLIAFVVLFGLSQGARGPIITSLVAKIFPDSVGVVFGATSIGIGLGAALGSSLLGYLYDATGGYEIGLALAFISSLCGLAPFWLIRSMRTGKR